MGNCIDRRDLLKGGVGAALGIGLAGFASNGRAALAEATSALQGAPFHGLPSRILGMTGRRVSILGLAGMGSFIDGDRDNALAMIQRARALGITYFDTAPIYGSSEELFGEELAAKRGEVFLATKTHDRTRDGSLRLLEASLKRLRTDHVDMWQIHHLTYQGEVDEVFAKGGALEALMRAKEEGMVRHLGVTGHDDPAVLASAMERFSFDVVLTALNVAEAHERPFSKTVLPLAVSQKMGVVANKSLAAKTMSGGPLAVADALGWVWDQPVACALVGARDLSHIEANVKTARSYAQRSTLIANT